MKNIKKYLQNKFSENKPLEESIKPKVYITANMTLELRSSLKLEVQKTRSLAKKLIKENLKHPEKLLDYIEENGTKIVKSPLLKKVLILFRFEEGFIAPFGGLRAIAFTLLVNILSTKKIPFGLKTPPMFVVIKEPLSIYSFSHQFHHWLAYKRGLPGYEEETLDNFRIVLTTNLENSDFERLFSIEDIFALKEAIERDREAIEFVKDIAKEFVGAKKSCNKLANGESLSL